MKYWILSLFSLISLPTLFSQNTEARPRQDSLYYRNENGFLVECPLKKAEGFSIVGAFQPEKYTKLIWFLGLGTPMAEFECYDKEFVNKATRVSSTYTIKHGNFQDYYVSGERKLACHYTEGKLDGEFKVFYQNGKVKRLETWNNGEWVKGECFDEQGNPQPYCSYQEQAEFMGGIPEMVKYLGSELTYPKYARKHGIEGTVYVEFVVEKDGSLSSIAVKRGIEEHLNEEAVRIVSEMPKWKPGKHEGVPVRYQFVLPIKFALE